MGLVNAGASLQARMPYRGHTPLLLACDGPSSERLRLCCWILNQAEGCVTINIGDRYGRTPLHAAAEHANEPVVRTLLQFGANPFQSTLRSGQTPLASVKSIAARLGKKRVFYDTMRVLMHAEQILHGVLDVDWRPSNHARCPRTMRSALRTLAVLAKATHAQATVTKAHLFNAAEDMHWKLRRSLMYNMNLERIKEAVAEGADLRHKVRALANPPRCADRLIPVGWTNAIAMRL